MLFLLGNLYWVLGASLFKSAPYSKLLVLHGFCLKLPFLSVVHSETSEHLIVCSKLSSVTAALETWPLCLSSMSGNWLSPSSLAHIFSSRSFKSHFKVTYFLELPRFSRPKQVFSPLNALSTIYLSC